MAIDETEREVEVLEIFRQILGAPQLGPEQNFFDSGGSSLLAARLAARLRSSGVLDVPTSAVFAAPTARALTRYASSSISPLVAATPGGSTSSSSSAAGRGARQRAAFARLRPTNSSPDEEAR
jgi:Phosphopantetheine attachment site